MLHRLFRFLAPQARTGAEGAGQGEQDLAHLVQLQGPQLQDLEEVMKGVLVLVVGLQDLVAGAEPEDGGVVGEGLAQPPQGGSAGIGDVSTPGLGLTQVGEQQVAAVNGQ